MRKIFTIFWLFGCVILVQAQWSPVTVPTNATLFTIAFTDTLNGCISGTGIILKTYNGGGIWQPVYLDPMGNNLTDICFPTPQAGYAAGDYSIMKTTDGGDNWSTVWTPVGGIIRGVYFLNADTGWICAQGEEIWRTDDGGTNWYNQMTGAYWLRQFDFPTPMLGFCVGDGGNIYKTTDGGITWILQTNATTTNITDVFFLTPDTGFVAGNDSYVAKTCDGGATWQQLQTGVATDFQGCWFFDSNNGYAVGTEGIIVKTEDGGITWTQVEAGTASILRNLFFFDPGHGFICGHDGTLLSNGFCTPMAAYSYDINDLSAYFTNGSDCANAFWWDFGDGYYSDLENPWHLYDSAGTYQVCLTAIDPITLRSDTVCQVLGIFLGVDEYSSGMVALYPNPCNDRLSLECRGEVRSARLGIYNSLGALVLCEKIQVGNGQRAELKLDFPSGLYLAVGFDDKGTLFSKRLVVSR